MSTGAKDETLELHIWGSIEDVPSFSPDCLAAIWYLSLTAGKDQPVAIVPSSNTGISSSGVLPALRHNGKVSLSYIDTQVAAVSQYMLFVHQQNYEHVTRPLISSMIPFPMQYQVPMQQRSLASQQCAAMGLVAKGSGDSHEIERRYPTLGRLQEQLEENKKQSMLQLGQAKESMKVLGYTHEVLDNIVALGSQNEEGSWNLFGSDGKWTSADLLLGAHLTIQTLEGFPVPIVKKLLTNEYPQVVSFIMRVSETFKGSNFNIVSPDPQDVPSLYNWVMSSITDFYSTK